MSTRTPFPPVFWIANTVEVLERFAYYGIYFGFGIYMTHLGYSREQLGIVQSIFLLLSYITPIVSGTFADRFGFKKVLIISYLAYLPSILLLIFTKSFSGIVLTMLSIGLAAGIFKPLILGTIRAVTDRSNTTLGFGIFYAMVNIGGSFGPIVAGRLRAISWNYAFMAAAVSIGLMLLITIFFYKEPPREIEGATLGQKFRDIGIALSDLKFLFFLVLLGFFFWLPFWAFFNLCALYVDSNLDTARLYLDLKGVFGEGFAGIFSAVGDDGVRRVLGETISHTGYIIMVLQVFVSRFLERFRPIPSFATGLLISAIGFIVLGYAEVSVATWVFLGIFLFAVGEMISSPRIQEYITWIAPKEKAGLYVGTNFLGVAIGAFTSGITYTTLYGWFSDQGHPERTWYVLAAHIAVGAVVFLLFSRFAGGFKEQEV
ncbi:MAG TPA: MFS transporter [Thermoanaerobaculia bacterium]|nr:MFS transporter [Thermoanaerobaculia bacterium]